MLYRINIRPRHCSAYEYLGVFDLALPSPETDAADQITLRHGRKRIRAKLGPIERCPPDPAPFAVLPTVNLIEVGASQ
jgi:hypothetical protein